MAISCQQKRDTLNQNRGTLLSLSNHKRISSLINLCIIIKIMLRKAKTMDEELKKEFKKINRGLNRLNTRIGKLEGKESRNVLDAKKSTLATVGFSLVLAGCILQIQQNNWSSSGLFIVLGTLVAVLASYWGTPHFLRSVRIAFWVLLGIAVGITVYLVVAILSA